LTTYFCPTPEKKNKKCILKIFLYLIVIIDFFIRQLKLNFF